MRCKNCFKETEDLDQDELCPDCRLLTPEELIENE